MAEGPERRALTSAFRIVDDTLEELGLPGPFDVVPTPSEVIRGIGLPTPNDLGEALKARMMAEIGEKRIFRR